MFTQKREGESGRGQMDRIERYTKGLEYMEMKREKTGWTETFK
jgi:hypothetical protein